MARTKTRETYGNGSITQAKDSRTGELLRDKWRIAIELGTDENGKRIRKRKTISGSLADARKVCKQMQEDFEHVDFEIATADFRALASVWIEAMRNAKTASTATINQYERCLGYLAKYIGDMPIIEIKSKDIEHAMGMVKRNTKLSDRTLNLTFATAKRMFSYAVDTEALLRNPCNGVLAPKKSKTANRKSLTEAEVNKLRAYLDRDEKKLMTAFLEKEQRAADWGKMFARSAVRGIRALSGLMAIRLMLATGMRRGEALGLTWEAVNFEDGALTIKQNLTQFMEIKTPKTASGVRSMAIDADTLQHLKTWKEFQARAMHRIKSEADGDVSTLKQTPQTPVCCNDLGSWYNPNNFSKWWDSYRVQIGFSDLKVHELRHTQATLLLGNGVDVKTVQTRLGHASSSLTLDQYAHAIPANDKAAADLFGQILSKQTNTTAEIIELKQGA